MIMPFNIIQGYNIANPTSMVSGAWTKPKESAAGIGDPVSDLCCVYQVWMGLNDCPSGSNIATPMCP